MWREFWYHRNLQVFNGVFKSGGCFSPHKSVCLLIRFGYFLLVLVCVCLGFFTLMDYVDSCETHSDFTCKMWSEINVFDMKCEIDDIPRQYLRCFVRIVICIVGKLSICTTFWIEEKSIYNFYMRKPAEGKLALQVCFSCRMCRVYWNRYLTKHAVRLQLHFLL